MSTLDDNTKRQYISQWQRCLKDAIDADTWGQAVEACESYAKLIQLINLYISDYSIYSTVLNKFIYTVQLRSNQLNDIINTTTISYGKQQIKLEQIKLLNKVITDYFNTTNPTFPIELTDFNNSTVLSDNTENHNILSNRAQTHTDVINESAAHQTTNTTGWKHIKNNETYIKLYIYKIGLKDVDTYERPYISIVLADKHGTVIETYDLQSSKTIKLQHIYFDQTVYIQTCLNEIQRNNYTVFIEFKHYKAAKNKISTRCYSILEHGEILKSIGNKNTCLELYKKPVDYSMQKIALHTIKPLYLHCTVTASQ